MPHRVLNHDVPCRICYNRVCPYGHECLRLVSPEMVAEAALQEDVDVVGLSILSGAHMALVPRVLELLKANGQDGVRVFVGGIIPDEDVPRLKDLGVVGIYGPGAPTETIIQDIRRAVAA